MDYESFLKLCDERVSNMTYPQIDSKEGYEKMKSLSGNDLYFVREKLIYLQKKIIYEHVVNERPLEPYMTYVYVLMDGIRDNKVTKEQGMLSSINWPNIISVLGEIKSTNSLMKINNDFENLYAKHFDFSKACLSLISKGFAIVEIDDAFYFDSNYYNKITKEIDDLAMSVGGCNILHAVFNIISNSYDANQKRFHIHRKLSMGHDRPLPEVPWAYLIALGAKHSNHHGDSLREENFSNLIALLSDIVTVFEVQDYSPYESWYVDHYGLTGFLSDEIIFDNLFCISQMHGGYVQEILDYVVHSVEFSNLRSYGFSIGKIYNCGLALLNKSLDKQITDISFKFAKDAFLLGTNAAKDMIGKILLNESPNKELEFPPRNTAIDNSFNQLLPFEGGYLLMPRSLSSLAFLNNTLNSIIAPDGQRNKHNDKILGGVLEEFVKRKLHSYGIAYRSGNYISKDGLVSGESDITIETKSAIIFIEIKKKGMTRLSMSGVDYSILSDLGEGLIHATSQCFKAERILRCDGEINIDASNPILYKSQRIIKVALTLYDYGSFQDRMTIRSILTNSLGATFKVADSKIDKKLKDWKKHINELSEHTEKLSEYGQLDDEPFHSLFFISIPQLLMILEDKPSAEGLEKAFRTLSSINHSTRDFYKEYLLNKPYM